MRPLKPLISAFFCWALAQNAWAEVTLVADNVNYDTVNKDLVAHGKVQVFYEDKILEATRIIYNSESDRLDISGPLILHENGGNRVLAENAILSSDFKNGIIEGARLLLENDVQLAAKNAERDGEINILHQAVASACRVCSLDDAPIWQIRGELIIHDPKQQRISVYNGAFDVMGRQVLKFSHFSFPDPSAERVSGYLVPRVSNSSFYGAGLRLPYYLVIDDYSDFTLTPFITTKKGVAFETEYRRNFYNGWLRFDGTIKPSSQDASNFRGYANLRGHYDLPYEYNLDYDLAYTSDKSYLQEFDYSDDDRLTSEISISKTTQNSYFRTSLLGFQTLLEDEDNDSMPFALPEFTYQNQIGDIQNEGLITLFADGYNIIRNNDIDNARLTFGASWQKDWYHASGVITGFDFGVDGTGFLKDSTNRDIQGYYSPHAKLNLKWPLAKQVGNSTHILEPILQMSYQDSFGEVPENEDSRLPGFDITNLFVSSRYPGYDRRELGAWINTGLNYRIYTENGWAFNATAGHVFRLFEGNTDFDSDNFSDYINNTTALGFEATYNNDFSIYGLTNLDKNWNISGSGIGIRYETPKADLNLDYIYIKNDFATNQEIQEISLSGRYRFQDHWEVLGAYRYNIADSSPISYSGGLTYGNECIEIGLKVKRRYTSTNDVEPSTSVGLTLDLLGLGSTSQKSWPRRTCAVIK